MQKQTCQKCKKEFQTLDEDKPDIIYCESCYQQEIY